MDSNYYNIIDWPTFDYIIYKISYLAWVTVRIEIREDSMNRHIQLMVAIGMMLGGAGLVIYSIIRLILIY